VPGDQDSQHELISASEYIRGLRAAAIPSLLDLVFADPRSPRESAQHRENRVEQESSIPRRRVRAGRKKKLAILNAQRRQIR